MRPLQPDTTGLALAEGVVGRLLNAPLFTLARTPVTLLTLITFGLVIGATLWLSHLAQRGTTRAFRLRGVRAAAT